MNNSNQIEQIPENIIRMAGRIFFSIGVVLFTLPVIGFFGPESEPGYITGIGIVSGIFGAVLLLHKKISKKISLIGTILFYSIAIAGTILALYNPHIVEILIWIVSISSVIAMFFTLSLATNASLD